jgi:hypothetical protein
MGLKFRRGTTAQKSGSLAFGEPYVNTDLGTLQIGGASGDITLGASGTGSTGTFGAISGSGLRISGNAQIDGNLTLGGAITIGDNTTDTVNVVASLSSSLIPSITNTFDLGSSNYFWRDIYVSTGSIKFVGAAGQVVGTLTNTGNGLNLDGGLTANGNSSFGTSSAAVTSVTGSLNVSGSVSVIGALSASTITGIGNVSSYSTSVDSRLVAAEAFSSSLDTTFATDASVTSLSTSVATAISASDAEYTLFSASAATTLGSLSSSVATSISASDAEYTLFSASAASGLSSLSSSVKAVTDTFATSASVASATATSISSLSSSVKAVTDTFATSASVASATATSISTLSGSVKTVTDALSGRVTTLEGKDISVTLTGDVTGTGTITDLGSVSFATTIAANSVALGTDTTGDYVGTITAGTGVSSTGATTGEGIAHTISIGQAVATSSDVRFNSIGVGMAASTTAGRIDASGDIVAFSSSDRNFKENITPIENPIEKIRKISGNTYDWKADLKDVHGYEGNDVGVIAQEIEEVLPQIVTTRENGYKAVKYDKLVALLIEGIKEQQNQIDSLTIEIEKLKKNNSL